MNFRLCSLPAALILLQACGFSLADFAQPTASGSGTSDAGATTGADSSASGDANIGPDLQADAGLSALVPSICPGTGTLDFSLDVDFGVSYITSSAAVFVSALEPDRNIYNPNRSMLLAGRLDINNSLQLQCPRALNPNGMYPSIAVLIDRNGNGRCDNGDFGFVDQAYAWGTDDHQHLSFPRGWSWELVSKEDLVPSTFGGGDFCSLYFSPQ